MGKMLYIYSSLFISLALNIPKLITLRETGVISHFYHFNLYELLFQMSFNFVFCLCIFYVSVSYFRGPFRSWHLKGEGLALFYNILLLFAFTTIAIRIQRQFFGPGIFLPGRGIGVKFLLTVLLILIELRIVDILRQSRLKEIENGRLRNAYLKAELSLLKGQLQPHFFFNALSSLSGVVREDPAKAQYYINQLSKFFRYSLQIEDNSLVLLKEEISAVTSYAALLKMRYEEGFELLVNIPEDMMNRKLPHMSLQPLVENALKHNIVMAKRPLLLEISYNEDQLIVKNNLQPVHFPEPGTGIGLSNLNERCKILLHKEIGIEKTAREFIVKLPLN